MTSVDNAADFCEPVTQVEQLQLVPLPDATVFY